MAPERPHVEGKRSFYRVHAVHEGGAGGQNLSGRLPIMFAIREAFAFEPVEQKRTPNACCYVYEGGVDHELGVMAGWCQARLVASRPESWTVSNDENRSTRWPGRMFAAGFHLPDTPPMVRCVNPMEVEGTATRCHEGTLSSRKVCGKSVKGGRDPGAGGCTVERICRRGPSPGEKEWTTRTHGRWERMAWAGGRRFECRGVLREVGDARRKQTTQKRIGESRARPFRGPSLTAPDDADEWVEEG